MGIVTLASFACQSRDALIGRIQGNQWVGEFGNGAGDLQNPLSARMTISPLAGKPAPKEMLIDPAQLERDYFERRPDLDDPASWSALAPSMRWPRSGCAERPAHDLYLAHPRQLRDRAQHGLDLQGQAKRCEADRERPRRTLRTRRLGGARRRAALSPTGC